MGRISHVASVCRWLPTPDSPSAGVFVLRRLEAMAEHAAITVVQPVPHFPVLRNLPGWARQDCRQVGRLPIFHERMFYVPKVFKSLDGYWLYRAIISRLRAVHSTRTIDVVDAHFGYPDGVGACLAARRLGIPFFVTFRGLEADYLEDAHIRPQIQRTLRDAAGCICVSSYLAELAIRYGADPHKVRVIHNAVDKSLFRPGSRSNAREQLGLSVDRPLVVSVGHLVAVKGHHTLITAFRSLLEHEPNAQLAIIGGRAHEAKYPDDLRALAERLGIGDSVNFVGGVPPSEVANWLRAADVFALATQREGCCNAILEALATGTPVVTTPVGDNAHFVKSGHNGFIVPVDDAGAMANGLTDSLTRRHWDSDTISASLSAGDWAEVAGQVFDFLEDRASDDVRRMHARRDAAASP